MTYYFRCPKCGFDKRFIKPSEEASDLGCALLLFGALIPALMFADYKRRRIQCARCAYIFRQPPIPRSPLARFAGWILALTVIPVGIAVWLYLSPDLARLLPPIPVVASIEAAITAAPRVAAYLLVWLFVLIVLSCWIAACVSNVKFRRKFSTEYSVKPTSSRQLGEHIVPEPDAPDRASPNDVAVEQRSDGTPRGGG